MSLIVTSTNAATSTRLSLGLYVSTHLRFFLIVELHGIPALLLYSAYKRKHTLDVV